MAAADEVPESLTRFTRGDRVAAVQLVRALEAIAEHAQDPEVRRSARQVLDGRRTLREITREPAFVGALGQAMDVYARQWSELSPEERVALAREGKREAEGLAVELGLDGDPEPADVGDFGPARTEPDGGASPSGAPQG